MIICVLGNLLKISMGRINFGLDQNPIIKPLGKSKYERNKKRRKEKE